MYSNRSSVIQIYRKYDKDKHKLKIHNNNSNDTNDGNKELSK